MLRFIFNLVVLVFLIASCKKTEVVEVIEESEVDEVINNELIVQIDTIELSLTEANGYMAKVAMLPPANGVSFTPRLFGQIGGAFVSLPARVYYFGSDTYLLNYSFGADSVTVFEADPSPGFDESLDRKYIFLWMPTE